MDESISKNSFVYRLNTINLDENQNNHITYGDVTVRLIHFPHDPPNVNRLTLTMPNLEAFMLPSKGLSLEQVYYKNRKIFWEAPYPPPDPEKLDLWSDEVLIHHKPMPGFTYLKTFAAGIEFYGLRNWGMPVYYPEHNNTHPLHGETSNIPVKEVTLIITRDGVEITSEFIYFNMPGTKKPGWYKQGNPLYKVRKSYYFSLHEKPLITITDSIENISKVTLKPDFGYHITFNPRVGSKIMVPSGRAVNRGGGKMPNDIETWFSSKEKAQRIECGIIHQSLKTEKIYDGQYCKILVYHPDDSGILCYFPPAPYFQTWSCNGGAGSDEFMLKDGTSLLEKNWDGLGIEFGSSALDHDGNVDPNVGNSPEISPGKTITTKIMLQPVSRKDSDKFAQEITRYNNERTFS